MALSEYLSNGRDHCLSVVGRKNPVKSLTSSSTCSDSLTGKLLNSDLQACPITSCWQQAYECMTVPEYDDLEQPLALPIVLLIVMFFSLILSLGTWGIFQMDIRRSTETAAAPAVLRQ